MSSTKYFNKQTRAKFECKFMYLYFLIMSPWFHTFHARSDCVDKIRISRQSGILRHLEEKHFKKSGK
ncbi:hypothetical protein L596_004267 [Steinernema carpocapsae]|uniref:Uncharacterized protein n=1 Tax=Steinernema carpocapsae TaxID=34508 RepID=A0A4U8UV73_STECR|nr:hypothetical protein L596_004267 [Steinernema carpocapsae]